jgi:hypothetical protein
MMVINRMQNKKSKLTEKLQLRSTLSKETSKILEIFLIKLQEIKGFLSKEHSHKI